MLLPGDNYCLKKDRLASKLVIVELTCKELIHPDESGSGCNKNTEYWNKFGDDRVFIEYCERGGKKNVTASGL